MDAKAVVDQLRSLARDPVNQPFIARDKGCIQGLVNFSAAADNEIVFAALEGLYFLSTHAENKTVMVEQRNLVDNVTSVAKSCRHDNSNAMARQVLAELSVDAPPRDVAEEQDGAASGQLAKDRLASNCVRMRVEGDAVDVAESARRVIVGERGIVSVVFDEVDVATVTFRADRFAGVPALVAALDAEGVTALVLETGAEADEEAEDKENAPAGGAGNAAKGMAGGKPKRRRAITTTTETSLEARLAAAKRQERKKAGKVSRFLNTLSLW